MTQELKSALFTAESVAHMRGYEREILPLADYARGQAARIAELEASLAGAEKMLSGLFREIELPGEWEGGVSTLIDTAREVLARTVQPLTPEN